MNKLKRRKDELFHYIYGPFHPKARQVLDEPSGETDSSANI